MKTRIIKNKDSDLVSFIKERLRENNGYCPCALEQTPDTKCMCKEFREVKEGYCHCGLYQKIKDTETIMED